MSDSIGISEIAERQTNVAKTAGLSAMRHRKVWDSHRPLWLQAGLAEAFGVGKRSRRGRGLSQNLLDSTAFVATRTSEKRV